MRSWRNNLITYRNFESCNYRAEVDHCVADGFRLNRESWVLIRLYTRLLPSQTFLLTVSVWNDEAEKQTLQEESLHTYTCCGSPFTLFTTVCSSQFSFCHMLPHLSLDKWTLSGLGVNLSAIIGPWVILLYWRDLELDCVLSCHFLETLSVLKVMSAVSPNVKAVVNLPIIPESRLPLTFDLLVIL